MIMAMSERERAKYRRQSAALPSFNSGFLAMRLDHSKPEKREGDQAFPRKPGGIQDLCLRWDMFEMVCAKAMSKGE